GRQPALRVDPSRQRVGDRDEPALGRGLIRIERYALLAAHDLHLRGCGSDDVGKGAVVLRRRELGRRPRDHVSPSLVSGAGLTPITPEVAGYQFRLGDGERLRTSRT